MTAVVAIVSVMVATALFAGPPTPRVRGSGNCSSRSRLRDVGLGLVALVAVTAVGAPRIAVLAMGAAAVAAGGARLMAAHRRAGAARQTRLRVIELCDALEAELVAGQTPGAALARAAEEWPVLGSSARVATAGGDVPTSLRELAEAPGAQTLRVVAAAWQVAHRTGHGLADSLSRVAIDLRAAEQTRRVVAGELASARATARLLAVLPVFALAIGSGAGAAPWAFLVGHPLGLACLGSGLAFAYAGLVWIEALARDVERSA